MITGNPESQIMKDQQALLMIIFPYASQATVVISNINVIRSLMYLSTLRKKYEKEQEIGDESLHLVIGWHTYFILEHASATLLPIVSNDER